MPSKFVLISLSNDYAKFYKSSYDVCIHLLGRLVLCHSVVKIDDDGVRIVDLSKLEVFTFDKLKEALDAA